MAKLLGVRGSNPARLFGDGGLKVIDPRRVAASNDADAAVGRLTDPSPELASVIHQYVFDESLSGRWQHVTRIWMTQTNAASAYTCLKSGSTATPAAAYTWSKNGIFLSNGGEVNLNYDSSQDYADALEMSCGVSSSHFEHFELPNTFFASSAAGIGAITLSYDYAGNNLSPAIGGASAVVTTMPEKNVPILPNRTDVDPGSGYARVRVSGREGLSNYAPFSLAMPDICLITGGQRWRLFYMASYSMDWEGFRDSTQAAMTALDRL